MAQPESVEIFNADASNLEEMFALAENFWHESNFQTAGLTLAPDFWKNTVRAHIGLPDTAGICASIDGAIVGYVLVYYQTDYTVERIGEMFQFYVKPEYRSTKVARKLVEAAVNQYKEWGCARAYCEASPGIAMRDHLALFRNLWGKYDYQEIGVTLMKEF